MANVLAEWSRSLRKRAAEPVDGASLGLVRVAFGLLVADRCWSDLRDGFVDGALLEPAHRLTYDGFHWVAPWPGVGLHVHVVITALAGLLLAAGALHRVAALVFTLGHAYLFLLDETHYLNHDYLIGLLGLLLAALPADRALSVRALRRGAETIPRGAIWLLRAQIGLVYFYAGVAKLNADWLSGWPLRIWLADRSAMPLVGPWLEEPWLAVLMSWSGAAIDLAAWPLLSHRRTRPWMFGVLLSFHFLNAQLFDIGVFPMLSVAVTTIFFAPDWPRRWLRLGEARAHRPSRRPGALFALGALWLAVQLALPLRPFFYPGDPSWTEEGHRFSWHMKLRDKDGEARFFARDPESGAVWELDLRALFTEPQISELSGRPHLLHQAAAIARADVRARLGVDPEIRVEARVSLNGRAPQLLVDPAVDLARAERPVFGHTPWILPLEVR